MFCPFSDLMLLAAHQEGCLVLYSNNLQNEDQSDLE